MKKFIIIIISIVLIYAIYDIVFYRIGFFIDFNPNKEITYNIKTENKDFYIKKDKGFEKFEIKGVDMGSAIPGHFATDYAIDKETYKRWFSLIQDMGANTIRVYTILNDDFYNAFYEYNKDNKEPLYLIQGLWVNDYILNSRLDAFDNKFLGAMLDDSRTLVDVIHGRKKLSLGKGTGSGSYTKDISNWVIGYILGVEWEPTTVEYTNHSKPEKSTYQGKYMYTNSNASPFEAMLTEVGDKIIEYETKKYKNQRTVAFANWATTDPFEYPEKIKEIFGNYAKVDVEHIKTTANFKTGTFASYHIYPYYPDFLNYDENGEICTDCTNTYQAYLRKLNDYHTMPIVISEFGVPSSRGIAYIDHNGGRNQGHLSEQEQGEAIIDSYLDIKAAGIDNAIIFTWQDEWFKRTWNTMHTVDLTKTPYWSDYETNEQYFGLLAFDPGKEESICYVDGDVSEWEDKDKVVKSDSVDLSMKYDEKYIYFLVNKKNYLQDKIYIPIDITPNSGAKGVNGSNLSFDKDVDFLIEINGQDNSRVLVQEYYDSAKATLGYELRLENSYINAPSKNSQIFNPILMMTDTLYSAEQTNNQKNITFEIGKLTHGNANPKSPYFNSLADFNINGNYIEIKIPWGLLNFSDPSNMMIHDDYYKNYGVENKMINNMYVGVGEKNINLEKVKLKGWGKSVTYHERLKESYYMIKKIWSK